MSSQPTRPGTEIDPETEKIILERLNISDTVPKQDYREAMGDVVREGRQEVAKLKHPVPR